MKKFVNNFNRVMQANLIQGSDSLNAVADSAAVEAALPSVGDWGIFTLSKQGQSVVEVVKITRVSVSSYPRVVLTRAQEGTTDQDWLLPFNLSMRVTAETLTGFDNLLKSVLLGANGEVLTDGTEILTL